jgi:hypothetical protein
VDAPEEIADFARAQLTSVLSQSGEILYSAALTLRSGPVYLLGHNPGGDPNDRGLPNVGQSLDDLPTKTINSYLDTVWSRQHGVGQAPLQRRVVWLLESLGLKPRDVAASNLIFVRSPDVRGSRFREYSELCWPVHERILDVVKPRLVLVYGNSHPSPFEFLLNVFGADVEQPECPSGHGTWMCRSFQVPGRFRVVGLPHLSRYDVTGHPEVVRWINSIRDSIRVA